MPKVKTLIVLGLIFFVVLGAGVAWYWWQNSVFVPIKVVSLSNRLEYADPVQVKTVVSRHLREGLFALNMRQVSKELAVLPWVERASLQRCWPDTLKISIVERQPLAILNSKGVIDTQGKLFFPLNVGQIKAPDFVGPEDLVVELVATYRLILKELSSLELTVTRLELMPDNGWRAMLSDGTTIVLGQTELTERLGRFVLAYETLRAKKAVVDLRYTNGLAVAWGNS